MDLYTKTSYVVSRTLTLRYSTSFGQSSKLFNKSIQNDIFAIYGLVRVADEIVDTYKGADSKALLITLEKETYAALKSGFSPNPIVHAFAITAQNYEISKDLIHPFFTSMTMDLTTEPFTQDRYETYIYGSAEVIGLMCLKVFCQNDIERYDTLTPGAKALGAAYQKVNFLRDIASDYHERGRTYFPNIDFKTFNETQKQLIIEDIKKDFKDAQSAIRKLPSNAKRAVSLSFAYYSELLTTLEATSVQAIKANRIRVRNTKKVALYIKNFTYTGKK